MEAGKNILIPFNNLSLGSKTYQEEVYNAIQKVVESGWFILGKELESFEHNFANYIGTQYSVGVASGTEAIALSLIALNTGSGDEVITSNITAFPTISGIMQSGAKPVLVDIIESTGLINFEKIEDKITKKTKAIIPVNLYGQCCNLNEINAIARRNGLFVIEDCAQSTGATYNDKKCGTYGDCGAFSFYPTKNLGAYGDGGAITTNNEEIYSKLIALRNYGQTKRYYHDTFGINSRLDEIQAAILNVKLKYVDQENHVRKEIADNYRRNLQTVECLKEENYGKPSHHLFVVKSEHRNELIEHLQHHGIQSLIHYPIPVNKQKAFYWQKDDIFPESTIFADTILSLPIYPGLSKQSIDQIIHTVNDFNP